MGAELDLNDVTAEHPLARRELDALRAQRDELLAVVRAIEYAIDGHRNRLGKLVLGTDTDQSFARRDTHAAQAEGRP